MCFPLAAVAGAGLSAIGALAAGRAQAQQSEYNARVAETNARTASNAAAGRADVAMDENERLRDRNRVAAGKAGLNPSSGSAALAIEQEGGANQYMQYMGELWKGSTEVTAQQNRAADLRAQGKNQKQAGYFSAASGLLNAGARAYGGGLRIE